MTARELRTKYLEFFKSKGHDLFPSGSLVPYDVTGRLDDSLLFNGAGMVQFKPFFRGLATPPNKRLTNVQKCVRTGDIEEVGDLTHCTFFEMLGNFSFGDYFKKEAIAFSWEFNTSPEWLALDPRRIAYTVFEEDDEAFACWEAHLKAAGIDPEVRIFKLGEATNFWPAGALSSGPPGPCGPNSEMFYWVSDDVPPPCAPYGSKDFVRDEAAGKWLEFWNDVFIQFDWKGHLRNPERPAEGYVRDALDPLPFPSVDTGMGLERCSAVIGGFNSVYDTDVFKPIFKKIEEVAAFQPRAPLASFIYGRNQKLDVAARILADHIRTASFCIADGVLPSNDGRGYVLRRLIRRAVLKGQRLLGFVEPFFHDLYPGVVEAVGHHYAELNERKAVITETLRNEEALFRRTLAEGLKRLNQELRSHLGELVFEYQEELRQMPQDQVPFEVSMLVKATPPSADVPYWMQAAMTAALAEYAPSPDYFSQWREWILGAMKPKSSAPSIAREKYALFRSWRLPGDAAFRLYDTFGFPVEVTEELCAEAGIEVDMQGYEEALLAAQELSRSASKMGNVYGESAAGYETFSRSAPNKTSFVGYTSLNAEAEVVRARPHESEGRWAADGFDISLDQTPFYPVSGGQVGDTGSILIEGHSLEVTDSWREGDLIWHRVRAEDGGAPHLGEVKIGGWKTPEDARDLLAAHVVGKPVLASVDSRRRRQITRNHSATHLLHAALRQVLGKHVTQAGSLVAPDHLRFDFTHGKSLTVSELHSVEGIVNEKALEGIPVTIHADVPLADARQMGAMALFGEKYGDRVRVVQMDGFSLELCGGCHVRQTSEVGLFKITSEGSAASGVRRIEAVTGEKAYEFVQRQSEVLEEAAGLLKANPDDLVVAVERTVGALREEKRRVDRLRSQAATAGTANAEAVGDLELVSEKLTDSDAEEAKVVADRLVEGQPKRVAVVASIDNGKTMFVCKAGASAVQQGANAGRLVGEIAKIAGGGGGGRPDFATAGAKDAGKVDEALAAAKGLLAAQLGFRSQTPSPPPKRR